MKKALSIIGWIMVGIIIKVMCDLIYEITRDPYDIMNDPNHDYIL